MSFIKRFGVFILTNLLIMVTIGIVWGIVSTFFLRGLQGNIVTLMAYSAVVGMTGAFISLAMSRMMAKWMMGVKIIEDGEQHPELRKLVMKVHQFARSAGLQVMPQVGYYESPDLNAFATGPTKNRSLVAVSTGLMQRMNEAEIDGVLAHEVAHIANGDMVTMTLVQGVVNTFAIFFSRIVAGILASNVEEKNRPMVRWIATIVCDIAFTLLGSIIVAWFSRKREFRADSGSASIVGKDKMIAALRKLQQVYELPLEPDENNGSFATMQISHRSKGGMMALFKSHPDLEDRIQALQQAPR